jgi:hypothetical protein
MRVDGTMYKSVLLWVIVFIVSMAAFQMWQRSSEGFDEIEWRGQRFALSRRFDDWEDYKKAIHQVKPAEVPRISALMVSIEVPKRFNNRNDLIRTMPELRFPGYAETTNGVITDQAGRTYELSEYEIPETGTLRSLLYRKEPDGSYKLVMDAVIPDHEYEHNLDYMLRRKTVIDGGHLQFILDGKVYREGVLRDGA